MRHAQYRLELVDLLRAGLAPVSVAAEQSQAVRPRVTVRWTGSAVTRDDGWHHDYEVEICFAAYADPDVDELVARTAQAIKDWQPTSSAVAAAPPIVRAGIELESSGDADVTYPIVTMTTTVTEPST